MSGERMDVIEVGSSGASSDSDCEFVLPPPLAARMVAAYLIGGGLETAQFDDLQDIGELETCALPPPSEHTRGARHDATDTTLIK